MEENKVYIDEQKYHELLRKAERIEVVARIIKTDGYISTGTLKCVLLIDDENVDDLLDELEAANARIAELESVVAALENPPVVERGC